MAITPVSPDTTKIDLPDDDWILVKTRLNTGEQQQMLRRIYVAGTDGRRHMDSLEVGIAQVAAYLLDWSVADLPIRGKGADDVTAALFALDPEDFATIRKAVQAHEEKWQAARDEAKKKTLSGASESSATSPSPSTLAGPSTASVN